MQGLTGGTRTGITHFSIDSAGQVTDEDLIVDVHYNYMVGAALQLHPGTRLMPFARGNKTGLVQLEY